MEITVQEAALLVTAVGALTGILTFMGVRRRDSAKESEQKGKDKTALNGVVRDMDRIMDIEMPRLQQIEILTRENAVQIKNLAEIENKRSTSTDRMLNGIDTLVGALERERKKGP